MNKKSWRYLISEDEFWKVIEKSLLKSNQEEQFNYIFNNLTNEELIGLCYHGTELYRKAFTSELWAVAYIVRGGCGDDSFHYFRNWLVKRGKSIYYNALDNPDSLINELSKYKCRNEIQSELLRVDVEYYFRRKHSDEIELSEIIEKEYDENFIYPSEDEILLNFEFNWEENDENSLKVICPKIYKKFRKKPLKPC